MKDPEQIKVVAALLLKALSDPNIVEQVEFEVSSTGWMRLQVSVLLSPDASNGEAINALLAAEKSR